MTPFLLDRRSILTAQHPDIPRPQPPYNTLPINPCHPWPGQPYFLDELWADEEHVRLREVNT